MSAPSASSIIRVPGHLVWNPADLGNATGSPPAYGGTLLGTVRDIEFTPNPVLREVWAEEMGTVTDVIYGGERVLLTAVVRHDDDDMISAAAPRSSGSGATWLFRPGGTTGNTRAGTSLFGNAGVLMFAARAATAHPFLIMYNAIPAIDVAARLQFQFGEEYGLAVAFYGTPDSSGRVYDTGPRASLSL